MIPYTVMLIVPTGIGAAIGGYAGDALPTAKAISQVCDRLITHPNVMNGAQLYWNLPNTLYTEGYALDQFAAGHWNLRPVHQNKIGLLIDSGTEPDLIARHLQAADAARATLGLTLTDYVLTDEPLNVGIQTAESGATWGTIGNPDSLLRAADKLINQAGATAIAVVARFPEDLPENALHDYRHGQGVDPLAGAEAVISHLIVRHFKIPCAHAPALSPLELDIGISPKSAAEELGHTFLPCVLVGLSRAPQFVQANLMETNLRQANSFDRPQLTDIHRNQVNALVLPESACGGSALLHLSQTSTQIITVRENTSRMQVTPEDLGIRSISVNSYLEAIGVLVAHRSGISPAALSPKIDRIRCL
ncbi:MAG: DUF3326 domain-containing protein [Alkalinema sp. CAN_BIN05]|nr:DUF3326 domain-containing protein [Alkalinema sp. CAN_BIN05]